jgi:hypothetical protein
MAQYQLLIGAVIVAIALVVAALFGRYEIQAHGSQPIFVFRVDRLTGEIEGCMAYADSTKDSEQVKAQPKWCKASIKGL